MQVDMHYYGTYAIARAAGINQEAALRIAQAAQFVDDYIEEADLETSDGALISYWPTGHNLTADENFDPLKLEEADPHRVWVPFHFLPGGVGHAYKERMSCVTDSATAKAAMETVLRRAGEPCILELAGILAHVNADTFSHYGFVGLHCDENKVAPTDISLDVQDKEIKKYLWDKAKGFFDKFAGSAAGAVTRNLGHASVADFPDRPYLRWSFKFENGEESRRDNKVTYMEYCENLFGFFLQLKAAVPQYAEDNNDRRFDGLRSEIADILAYEAIKEDRCSRWQKAAKSGKLLFSGEIPEYEEHTLGKELQTVKDLPAAEAIGKRIWHFVRAAEIMRNTILYDLLPAHDIIG